MSTLTWAVKQLGRLHDVQPDVVDGALGRLLAGEPALRWSLVLSAYLDEEINLGKAAQLLGLHELELRERFVALGVPLRIGAANLEEARAEVAAMASWFQVETA